MLNTVYRLVAPRRIEVEFNEINVDQETLIVRPKYLSICNADQRYYQGNRPAEVFLNKLPMALIHECAGQVVYDPKREYKPGTPVVVVPNTPTEEDALYGENYLPSAKFRGSGFDGFMQDTIASKRDLVIPLPTGIHPYVSAFTEFVSVGVHAIGRFDQIAHHKRDQIAVFGDGNLGYVVATLYHALHPEAEISVIGLNEDKLQNFTFAHGYLAHELPKDFAFDHGFECVGANGAEIAINQLIDHIRPEGTISLLGVSEQKSAINTRMVLEKGLRLFGSSRSGREDFLRVMEIYHKYPKVMSDLEQIVGTVIPVKNIDDMHRAFEADIHKSMGKTIMEWLV